MVHDRMILHKTIVLVAGVGIAALSCAHSHRPSRLDKSDPYPFSSPVDYFRVAAPPGETVEITAYLYDVMGEELGKVFEGLIDTVQTIKVKSIWREGVDSLGQVDTTFLSWDDLDSGIYFLRIVTPDTVYVAKLLQLK